MSLFKYATKRGTLRRRLVHSPGLPHHQPPPQSASTSLRSAAVPTLTLMTVGLRFVSCWFGVVGCVWCPPRVRCVCTRWWCGCRDGWQDFVRHICWRVRSLTVPAPEVRQVATPLDTRARLAHGSQRFRLSAFIILVFRVLCLP